MQIVQVTLISILIFPAVGLSQIHIEGKVLSIPKKEPIAFANIGILNASIGTISDQDGTFYMNISRSYSRDSILFSALGYEKVSVPISSLLGGHTLTIYLRETIYKLSEVLVIASKVRPKLVVAGNSGYEGGSLYADTVNAGGAMALLIKNKSLRGKVKFDYPSYVHAAELMIVNNTFKRFKVRVRLMDVFEIGGKLLPGRDLLEESVVVESQLFDGWLKFDLASYQLKVKGDFFLVFEWILEKRDRANLYDQYDQFRKNNPEKVTRDYSVVDGKRIEYENYQGLFYFGTSFGMSVDPGLLKEHTCYYRLSSFGLWYPSPSALTARIFLSGHPGSVGKQMELLKDSLESNEIGSYYRLNKKSLISDVIIHRGEGESTQPLFDSRMEEPIHIIVQRDENRFTFVGKNHSYYPYHLTLNFSGMLNLEPLSGSTSYTVYPGEHRLLSFSVVDPSIDNYHYELSTEESIGDPALKAQSLFDYLIPVGGGKFYHKHKMEPKLDQEAYETFSLAEGDTVYTMRKGIITYSPNSNQSKDRIDGVGSVEILHQDGTIMVYNNLDPSQLFYKAGDIALPGSPLGLIDSQKFVGVELYELSASEMLRKIPIHYYSANGQKLLYLDLVEGDRIEYPESVLLQELTEKERRKIRPK
ncbi:MAG: carboxypeptidase-like regulatory domain-containing protein [Saprospiraceae bacterium]|nr:carboxypeptidase-like regulatory domain-containing protein [Saprospiraceae bacterium]